MADDVDVIFEASQYSEETLVEEGEELHLEYDSEGEISGDIYHMNIAVDFITADDNTEADKEFIDALVEIEGQKAFPCAKCDKICKSKGGLTRHINSKHRNESVGDSDSETGGLCQDTVTSFVETIKDSIIKENLYGDQINTSLKTASATKDLFTALLPLYKKFLSKKNQDKLLEDFYGLIPRSCEFLSCADFRVANLIMIHIPDHLVGFYNTNSRQTANKGSTSVVLVEQAIEINPAERGPLSYIGGYVVSQLFKKNKGKNEDLQALLQNMKSTSDSNNFIASRTRGGLVTPCDDLVGILEEAEVLFRNEISKSKLALRNIPTDSVCYSTLQSPKVKSLRGNIVFASGVTSSTTELCLENVVKLYLKVRSFSYAKDYVAKYKAKEKELRKKALRKDMKQSSHKE